MQPTRGLVLADDATGALECASLLAAHETCVSMDLRNEPWPSPLPPGVLVVDTETRHLRPEDAELRLRRWVFALESLGWPLVYKKTDSTLRGNIAAELSTLLELGVPLVYIPAYPAMGRTVLKGRLLVAGVPVEETAIRRDVRQPVRESRIAHLFPEYLQERLVLVPAPSDLAACLLGSREKILICDAQSEEDLDAIAAVLAEVKTPYLLASPAGFIPRWVRLAQFPKCKVSAPPKIRDWLVVCGSLHPVSRRQADLAREAGVEVLSSPQEIGGAPAEVAAVLAERVRQRLEGHKPEALLILGGDTAWAIWRALNIQRLEPLGEILPGVPACRAPERDLVFVTKAGAFGDDSLWKALSEKLR